MTRPYMDAGSSSIEERPMLPRDFDRIRQMAYEFCGIDLGGKQVLVGARLGKKLRELELDSFEQYCDLVENDPYGDSFTEMIDALTTNHTSFLRESQHFEFLRKTVLPALPGDSGLQIWSAACSSGEEPYSIAFSLASLLGYAMFSRLSITATDISTRVLKKAQQGLYDSSALSMLPADMLHSCLLKGTGRYEGSCLVKREIRELVEFRQLNLLRDCSSIGPFHVIFCRNVMIYFDQKTQQRVVNNLITRLASGGYLLIGHSESLNSIEHPLKYVCSATYRKSGTLPTLKQSQQADPPRGVL